jgi:hypothetical protein
LKQSQQREQQITPRTAPPPPSAAQQQQQQQGSSEANARMIASKKFPTFYGSINLKANLFSYSGIDFASECSTQIQTRD